MFAVRGMTSASIGSRGFRLQAEEGVSLFIRLAAVKYRAAPARDQAGDLPQLVTSALSDGRNGC
jgi:hypothetical protein